MACIGGLVDCGQDDQQGVELTPKHVAHQGMVFIWEHNHNWVGKWEYHDFAFSTVDGELWLKP